MLSGKINQTPTIERILDQLRPRLEEAGFRSINDIVLKGATAVSQATDLDLKICQDICNHAKDILVQKGVFQEKICLASDILARSNKLEAISTGSHNLDSILGGRGIEAGAVTQFSGQPASGKTQLCHCIATIVTQPKSHGGLSAKAFYIDTEGTFRSGRIVEIARSRGFDLDQTLSGIMVFDVKGVWEQEAAIREIESIIVPQNIKLLIIDSIINHFKAEYSERSMLAERQHKINVMMHILQSIARTYRIAVVITNQVQHEPDSSINYRSQHIPLGGNALAHSSTHVIGLRLAGRYRRTANIVKSPLYVLADAQFSINEKGIAEPEKN